jgi:type II secretory pathway component PulF
MLDRAERMYYEQAFTSLQRALTLLGPIVFVLVATYLAVQVVSFWRSYYGTLDHIIGPGRILR